MTVLRRPAVAVPNGVRDAAAFAVGLVATAAGAGLVVPRLDDGASRGLLLGAAAVLAGLGLLVFATVALVRGASAWWRLPVVLGLLAATYVGLWSGVQAVAATTVPRGAVGAATPAALGLRFTDVAFPTRDGVTLSGWYVPSRSGAAVVLAHGAGATRSAVLQHAAVLARHGYGVLLFDARGHGRSGGRVMDFGWYGDRDLSAAVTFTVARPDVRDGRVGVVGLSMGGEEAIGAAAADPQIRAVVAEGATARTAADRDWLSQQYGVQGWVQEQIDRLTYGIADLLTDAGPPTQLRAAVAAAAPRPVLLIAGGDVPDEPLAGRFIQAGSPGTVRLWVVPGSGHVAGLAAQPQLWEQAVVQFLAVSLAR